MPVIESEGCFIFSRPAGKFSTKLRRDERSAAADLLSRSYAAARLAMRGDAYSPEDRQDCAADILARILDRYGIAPTEPPTFSTLYGIASNYRRSLDRRRAHEAESDADSAAESFSAGHVDPLENAGVQRVGTCRTAHRQALAMLGALGMRPLRKGDHALYVAAYTAARHATLVALDIEQPGETVAEELGISHANLRQCLSRAAKRLPSMEALSRAAHADALALDGGIARKPSKSRTASADLGESSADWARDPLKGSRPVEVWESYAARRPCTPPSWAASLPRSTRERLAAAAERRRRISRERTPEERAIVRATAGLPS